MSVRFWKFDPLYLKVAVLVWALAVDVPSAPTTSPSATTSAARARVKCLYIRHSLLVRPGDAGDVPDGPSVQNGCNCPRSHARADDSLSAVIARHAIRRAGCEPASHLPSIRPPSAFACDRLSLERPTSRRW